MNRNHLKLQVVRKLSMLARWRNHTGYPIHLDPHLQKAAGDWVRSNTPLQHHRFLEEIQKREFFLETQASPFLANTPAPGTFSSVPDRHVPLAQLLTREWLSIPIGQGGTSSGILVAGAIGSGKTVFISNLIRALTQTRSSIVIAFDRKGDLASLIQADRTGQVVGLKEGGLKIALLQRF